LPFIPEFLVDSFKKGRVEGKAEGVAEVEKRGEKRGMEKVLLAYIAKNPMLSDQQIADSFDIEVAFVQRLRKKVK
jgi:hypothetical protein